MVASGVSVNVQILLGSVRTVLLRCEASLVPGSTSPSFHETFSKVHRVVRVFFICLLQFRNTVGLSA